MPVPGDVLPYPSDIIFYFHYLCFSSFGPSEEKQYFLSASIELDTHQDRQEEGSI